MAFLIDNLQYYLQVDVLEGQFSILMSALQDGKATTNFEQIQTAHSVFQANILGFCFLSPSKLSLPSKVSPVPVRPVSSSIGDNSRTHQGSAAKVEDFSRSEFENPVRTILNQILECIYAFCRICQRNSIEEISLADQLEIKKQEEVFDGLMSSLLKLLVGMRVGPLSQLILRLDYNYWFSNTQKQQV